MLNQTVGYETILFIIVQTLFFVLRGPGFIPDEASVQFFSSSKIGLEHSHFFPHHLAIRDVSFISKSGLV